MKHDVPYAWISEFVERVSQIGTDELIVMSDILWIEWRMRQEVESKQKKDESVNQPDPQSETKKPKTTAKQRAYSKRYYEKNKDLIARKRKEKRLAKREEAV